MKRNIGKFDKSVRLIGGVAILFFLLTGQLSVLWGIILGIVLVALIITSFIGFDPIYHFLGISNFKEKENKGKDYGVDKKILEEVIFEEL